MFYYTFIQNTQHQGKKWYYISVKQKCCIYYDKSYNYIGGGNVSIDALINKENYSVEKTLDKIIGILGLYKSSDIYNFFGYCIIRLNGESACSSSNKISLKLLINITFIYYTHGITGNRNMNNYNEIYDEFIELMQELEYCYSNAVFNAENLPQDYGFHKSYLSYHFDFPTISIRQYIEFFYYFKDILEKEYNIPELSADQIIKGSLLLINFERALKANKVASLYGFIESRIKDKCTIKIGNNKYTTEAFTTIPINTAKLVLKKYKINYQNLFNALFISTKDPINKVLKYPTDVNKIFSKYIGIINENRIFLPRNFNIINKIFVMIMHSKHSIKKKDDYLEEKASTILSDYFGANNVFKNIYDEDGNEQDIIITSGDLIITVECKAVKFQEPFYTKHLAEKRLKQNFEKTIEKAYNQSLRVKNRIKQKNAKYYNSDKKESRELVADLSQLDCKNIRSIVITLEPYHNLATELHKGIVEDEILKFPLVIDIFSLEIILNKCLILREKETFINYLLDRSDLYGSVFATNNDELSYFGHYLNYGALLKSGKGKNIFTNLGSGYITFVTDYLLIDDYQVYREYLGI